MYWQLTLSDKLRKWWAEYKNTALFSLPLLFLRLPRRLLCHSYFSIWFLCYRWMSIYHLVNASHLFLKYLTFSNFLRLRNGISVLAAREMKQEPKTESGGRGRVRKETLADKPLDFENLRSPANAASDWLGFSNSVDMCRSKICFILRGRYWYVTRILIFSGCCLFWSARFALQCKSIFFDLFWNVRLFLRLYGRFSKSLGLSASVSFLSSPPPPRSFTYAIFRAIFDSLSSVFAPKPHGNACYAGYTYSGADSWRICGYFSRSCM